MIKKITMPSGGQNTDESLIVKWHVDVGDKINRGDVLFDIETDKATLEIESFASGYLLHKEYKEGTTVKEGEVVALIGDEKDKDSLYVEVEPSENEYLSESDDYQAIMLQNQVIVEDSTDDKEKDICIKASPLARKTAQDKGFKLEEIQGEESNKVIHVKDVIKFEDEIASQIIEESYSIVKHSNMRKIIASRMNESLSTSAHFSIFTDIDMSRVIELRKKLNSELESKNIKITFNDIIIKCAAMALKDVPIVNSSFFEDHIKVWKDVNFGIAVAVDNGIVVPVVRRCQERSLSKIAELNSENIAEIKDGKLNSEKLSGGTITLSSMGMLGVEKFTSIINQPESAILSVGAIEKKPIVVGDEILIRPIMTITSTFDHRGIDGAIGAKFTCKLKRYLEDPIFLLI
ncbi:MAG TPA: dihydrolipoamide acyltransferase [Eubacteriaceae bacterium]|jgi:pyruvate dehydrogenase E2 component (dihydrolipoamide acetyltransferase)|nr:dihydrolipoamide acyltransferase [Eubacteriaceae bacterium]